MKKLFLVLLCAGLFAACGNKTNNETPAADTTATTVEAPAPVEQPAVAEAQPAQQQQTTTTKTTKTTNTASTNQTVKEHANEAATNVANAAVDKAEKEATKTVNNSTLQNKGRR